MGIVDGMVRRCLYPLWTVADGNAGMVRYLRAFEDIDRLRPAELARRRQTALRAMMVFAYECCPYYREVFDRAGFDARGARVEDLGALPILTKAIVRERFADLRARKVAPRSVQEASTGGSTGTPMRFLRDRECVWKRKGQELYFDRRMGYDLGMKIGYFVSGSHYAGSVRGMYRRLRNATCERMVSFDPHAITVDYLRRFYREYQSYRPRMIKCFPNALMPFALYVKRNDLPVHRVATITCTGETLYARQKALFAEVFGAEVFEKVGTRESGVFAAECRAHQGLHVFTPGIVMELLDGDGAPVKPGEIGRVVVTDLFNRAMPLIRYEIGDMARALDDRPCPCGSPLPRIARYLGRDRDIVIDSDGNPRPGYLFVEEIRHLDMPGRIQIVQPRRGELVVRVVRATLGSEEVHTLLGRYRAILGPRVAVDVEYVDEIARDASGKYGYVVSKVSW
jgi:phenylacetate-CoA ligase